MSREKDFEKIIKNISTIPFYRGKKSLVMKGDSLKVLKNIPDHTISLILTDPPYHSTQKKNIYGDTSFKEDAHYIEWMEEYAKEWVRVLKPNGSLFCFCSPSMSAKLENSELYPFFKQPLPLKLTTEISHNF